MRSTPHRPRNRCRALLRAAVGTAAAFTLAASAASTASAATPADAGGTVFAPYTDMSNSQEALLDKAISDHGVRTFTAAFTLGTGCDQIWGDTLPVGDDPNVDPEIDRARSAGASVIISSGGAAGLPLAWTCTDQSAIEKGYQKVIDAYDVDSLDFDIEGGAIADTAAAARQMTAMKHLKAANPGLTFSVTLPVLPSGLTADGVGIVQAAKDAGVKIDNVNVMTMDYYQGDQDMGQAAIDAAKNTLDQMKSVDPGYTYGQVGITPMIGVNDDGSVFTAADAAKVKSWASANGVGRLSYWSVNRDQSCSAAAPGGAAPHASPTCSGVAQSPLAFADALSG